MALCTRFLLASGREFFWVEESLIGWPVFFKLLKTNKNFLDTQISQKSIELKPACADREHLTHEEDLGVSAFH